MIHFTTKNLRRRVNTTYEVSEFLSTSSRRTDSSKCSTVRRLLSIQHDWRSSSNINSNAERRYIVHNPTSN
ncbi:hypothetical protein LIS04_183 [Listeria phage LIS04]|nr:hypothetical protein LIS04_183 [Listeria phage LIS04]